MALNFRLLRSAVFLLGFAFLTSCHDHKPAASISENGDTNALLAPPVSIPATNATPPVPAVPSQPHISPEDQLFVDALTLANQGHSDAALEKANAAVQADPKNINAYSVRGQIYTNMKIWDKAEKDYEMMLQLDVNNTPAKFNLSELKFRQKAYDDARPGFVALEKDPDLGDLATYKVFLCDLFGGHDAAAKSEFDEFNNVGSNPSYYFGNGAWYLFHKQPEDARSWLKSGVEIYAPQKAALYLFSLKDLGYLPLPPPPSQ